MERLLGFDVQLVFDSAVTAVNVFILFAALSYFLFNPVRDFLGKRQERIKAELNNAKEAEASACALKTEYEDRLRRSQAEAEAILNDAAKKAAEREEQVIREAREEAALILERAQREIELKSAQAMAKIRQEAASMAAGMAAAVLTGMVDGAVQNLMIDKILTEMGENTWQA